MTVEQLIQRLLSISDKTKEICLPYSFGTLENGSPLEVNGISEMEDCIVLDI